MSTYGTSQYNYWPYGSDTGPDSTSPVVSEQDPYPDETGVANDKIIVFSLTDEYPGLYKGSIRVEVEGQTAYEDGNFVSPYNGPASAVTDIEKGVQFSIQKTSAWESWAEIPILVFGEDLLGNRRIEAYSFRIRDYLGPLVTPVYPANHQFRVAVSTNVTVSITDETVLQNNTIRVEIDQGNGFELAYEDGGTPEFKIGWNGPASAVSYVPGGVVIVIDPLLPFPSSALIRVRVTALDQWGNPERL